MKNDRKEILLSFFRRCLPLSLDKENEEIFYLFRMSSAQVEEYSNIFILCSEEIF